MTGRTGGSAVPAFTSACRNCNATLSGWFCAQCGQDHRHERLSLRLWMGDVLDSLINLESRVLRTIVGLTLRPGRVALDYVNGRRVPYISPVRYAVATCALWWFAVALQPAASQLWWIKYGQFINLASLPLLTPFIQVPFIGSRFNYAESLGFLLFTSGHLFLLRVGFALLALVPGVSAFAVAINITDSVVFLLYLAWALWQFHRGRVRWLAARIVGALVGITAGGIVVNTALMLLRRK